MTAASWRVVRAWVRATLPLRWRGLLSLALLVALLGAVSMASIAAARRTQAAFPSYLRASHASDFQVFVYDTRTSSGVASPGSPPALGSAIGRLRGVTHVATAPSLFVVPPGRGAVAVSNNEVNFLGSEGGAYFSVDRPVVVAGRMADPRDPHEVVASRDAARLLGWHVGERVNLAIYTLRQVLRTSSLPPTTPPAGHVRVTVTGIVVFADEVAHDSVNRYPTDVLVTPALTREMRSSQGFESYLVTVRGGDARVSAVERAVVHLLPPFSVYEYHVTSVVTGQVERAIRPESIALGAFGAIAALAALLIGAQAVRRHVVAQRADLVVARAIGADRATLALAASVGPFAAVALGAVLAAVLAVAASPIAPIGTVRAIDAAPGVDADVTVLVLGAATLVLVLGALAAAAGVEVARHASTLPGRAASRSRVSEAAARAGLPAPAVAGLRFSLERGSQRTAASAYSVLIASVVAVVVAVATVTFAGSLTTLTRTPSLYGWNWDDAILSPGGNGVPPKVGTLLSADPQVRAWDELSYAVVQVGGLTVPLLIADRHHPISPPLLAGHALAGPRQIVLGQETAAQLHVRVGSRIVVTYGDPNDYPIYVPPTRVQVVGIATMPAIGNSENLHTSMGVGAEVSAGIEPPAMQRAITQPDPNLNGPQIDVVAFRRGVSAAAGRAGLERIARVATAIMARDPSGGGASYEVVGAQRPAEILIYESTGATPAALAIALAVGTVVALAMALSSSVRRRRRDLALLKTLGFTRRQLAATIASQATVVALVGALFGVPLGIALGRWLWIRFAETIAAVPQPTVPAPQVLGIVLAAVVLANVVAALPGRAAARTPAGLVLRAE